MSPDILYIVDVDQLKFLQSEHTVNLILNGLSYESDNSTRFGSVVHLSQAVDSLSLLTAIQDIFNLYNDWNESMYQSILSKKPLAEIFDECSRIFRNPITLFDNSHTLLLKSSNIPAKVEDPLWAYILKHGYHPKVSLAEQKQLLEKYTTIKSPFYYQSSDQYKHSKRLIVALHYNHAQIGSIATTDICAPIDTFEYANMHYAQDIMEKALVNSDELKFLVSPTPHYIIQLLRGERVDKSIVEFNLSPRQKKVESPFRLLCFRSVHSVKDENICKDSLPNFARHFQSDFVYIYENQILLIDYRTDRYFNNEFLDSLIDFLSLNQFQGAGSMIFDDFTSLYSSYLQTQETFHIVNNNNPYFHLFEHWYETYIVKNIAGSIPNDCLIYPQLKKILTKEKSYAKELLICLEAFIFNGLNATKTSELLYLHRHTILYRINNLSQITGIDFSSLDQSALFQVYFSCKLLIHALT